MDPNGEGRMATWKEGICHDCTVLGGVIGLQTENGTSALDSGVYIHHILSFDTTKKTDAFASRCATEDGEPSSGLTGLIDKLSGIIGTMFVGVGEDNGNEFKIFSNEESGIESGFHIGPDDKFVSNLDLVNYGKDPIDVYVTLDIEFVDGQEGADAYSTLLDISGCSLDKPIQTDPNGPANTTSDKFPILSDGTIISASMFSSFPQNVHDKTYTTFSISSNTYYSKTEGHLHAGGEAMVLAINDQEVCVSEAEYGESSSVISGMSQCLDPIQVSEGDYLTMTSIYDMKAHPGSDEGEGHGGHGGHGGHKKRAPQGGMDMGGEDGGHMGGDAMGMFDIIFAPDGTASGAPASRFVRF